jgi:hypothetical protein
LASMPKTLLDSDEEGAPIKINENFARKYQEKKKREDLTSLRRMEEDVRFF